MTKQECRQLLVQGAQKSPPHLIIIDECSDIPASVFEGIRPLIGLCGSTPRREVVPRKGGSFVLDVLGEGSSEDKDRRAWNREFLPGLREDAS